MNVILSYTKIHFDIDRVYTHIYKSDSKTVYSVLENYKKEKKEKK